MLRINYTE